MLPARAELRRTLGVDESIDAILVAAGRGRAVASHALALLRRWFHVVVHIWVTCTYCLSKFMMSIAESVPNLTNFCCNNLSPRIEL